MAENPKQRFRRVLNDLSLDDRTFLDSGLRRIYSESLSYGLKNNLLTKDEVTKYQTLAKQRDTALRKVNVLDPQGNPISKETTIPVMRNGQVVQEKRVTPVTPFDLLRKTGGQMEGGSVDGPLFTGYTLDTGAPIGTARKKFQEEVIPTAQKAAKELERTRGESKFYQPGTIAGLAAGGLASIPVGIAKAVTAPLAAGVSRGIGMVNPEASRQFDESLAKAYYPEATVDVSQPFKTGVDVGQIAGIKAAEAIPATVAATIAGSAAAVPTTFVAGPIAGAAAGIGTGLLTAAGVGQAQNFLTELALGSSYKPAAEGFGFDIQRSPLSEARARFTQERTELAPSAAFAGEFAPNLLMGTPTLPKGLFGGAKAGLAATRLGQEGRAALTAASMPAADSLAGRFAATPVMQASRAVGQRLERIPGVGAAATFGRGFAQSEPGREFLGDIAERGVEGSADLYFALKENADKPADQRDPMWMILGKTALGSMFEGQHRLGTKLNAPGQALGMAAVRKLDERMGTFTPEAYTSLAPPVVPSPTATAPAGATATPRVPSPFTFGKTRVTGASTPLPTLEEGVVPIGGGMVARIAPTGEATVEAAPPVDFDRTPASSPSIGRNVLDALGGVAPKSNILSVGNIGRVGTRFGVVQSQGGESQVFLGLTHDGLVMVKATDKKTGESSIDLVSPDLLIGDNKRIAREAFKAGNLLPSDKTGYQRNDYDVELSRTADYEPTSEGEGPSSKDFDKEIRVSKNPIFGRVVKAIDENFSVMQIPSPVGGFDMMVVPNDTVTGLSRGKRAVAGEVLDTTSMNLDMSAYRVDRGKYDPIFKGSDRQRISDATHPIMLTPEQVADAATRKVNLGNFRNQLKAEGRAEGDVNTQYDAARNKSYADLRKTTPKATNDYAVGSTIDFTAADGEVSKGVVVGNTSYGPTVVDVANPMSPAFTVQEPQILSSSAEPTVKPEPEKKTTAKPKAEKKAPAKKEPVKKAEPVVEAKPKTPKVEPKVEVKPEPVKAEAPKEEVKVEPAKTQKPKVEKKVESTKAEITPTPKVEPEVPKAEVAPTPTVAVEPAKVEEPMPSGVPVSGYGVANPKEVAELIGEKRFELGKKLTLEQRKRILGKVGDSYVDQRHQKEFAGLDSRGEEMYRYPYSTGHMYVSNITGKFIRYYVVIPADITEGLIGVKRDIFAHPSELFPDINPSKAVELARTQRSSQLRQLLINANELQIITDDEFSKAINLLPRYVEEKLKENSTKVIEDILAKAETYNTPSQEVETLAKAIRDNASAGIPDFISQSLRDSLMGDELSKKIAYKALNGVPFDKNWNGAVIAGKARVKREAQAPAVEVVPEAPKPVVKPTISSADLIGESDITPSDEGSALNVTLPGDVQVLDDDGSLVRVQASIEGLDDINDVFRKARNVDELRDVLRGVIKDAGILKNPADIDAAADKLSKYYDEWLRAFVNRDLLIAQQYAQGIRKFASVETSGSQTQYGLDEVEILPTDKPQDAKQKRIRNRVARLYQAYDMPRIAQVVDLLNTEMSKKFVTDVDGTFVYDTSKTFFDTDITSDVKLNVVRKVQSMMLSERYRTNMPVFSVMSKAPQISEAFDKAFVGEGAYVNIKGKDNNIGQQVVFITSNQADVSTIVEELSHAILENMPIDMARQVATKLGKTLREPTTTNESVASYELQEMFAARMRLSLLTGEDAFTSTTGSVASRKRVSGLWDGIRSFLKSSYQVMTPDITESKGTDEDVVLTQWSVPYDPNLISLWDEAPIIFTDDDGKPKRGQIESTKKYPFGPGMVSAKNLEKPIVTVKLKDGTVKNIKPVQVLAISDFMGGKVKGREGNFTKQFGHMLLRFLSGSTGTDKASVVGLLNSYNDVTKAIQVNSYEGLTGKIDNFVDGGKDVSALFDYRLASASSDSATKSTAEGLLKSRVANELLGIVNQANRYGVLSDVDNDPKSALSLKNWLNAIGTLRAGEGLNEKSAFAKFYGKDAEFWMQSNIKKLQTAIRDAKEYSGALEGKGLFDDDAYHFDAGNTGGNLLYSSRQIGDSSEKNRALADGQASTLNPDAVTPVDFAMTATQRGMPRETITPVVQQRVIADAERNGLANSNIRLLEINDVLVIDGTVNISDAGIDTISKAIDFAARNNIQNTILVTKATPNEELGYNASKGYSVEPSITFQFEDPIADNVYAFIKRMHPYVRKSIDGQSLTIHNIEQKGKSYEESLKAFEQATGRIAKELAKRRIPVQAIQDTERVWNFGNESAQGYAVPYYEARNLLHLINPQVLETGQRPVSDPRVKDVLQTALSTVAGRNIKLPDIDFSSVPDNHERRLAMGSNYDKLPTNSYDTNPETKEAYDSLMSELDRQFSYLKLSAKEMGSDGVAKYTLPDVVSTKHPLMQDSKHKDVDGNPLRYIDVLNAIHDSISDSVKLVSGGEHSDLMAFAAHSAITKDPKAIRALYTETLGRKVYEQLSGKDVHKAALPTVEDTKTGIVALDKRVQALYAETKSPYGDLKKNEVTNGMGRVQYASGSGTPLYSLRPIRDVDVSDTGEPDVASETNPVIVVDDEGTEVSVTEESKIGKVLDFLDKNPVTVTFDVLNALGRFTMAGDWSAPLVQNWQLANPIESPGLFFKSLLFGPKSLAPNLAIDTGKGGINKNAFLGRRQVHAMGDEIRANRFYELAKENGLSLATIEYDRILAEKRAEREDKLAQMRERDPDATLPEIDIMDIDELDVDPDMMGLLSAERHVPGKAASERAMTMMKDFVKFNKFTQALEAYEQLGYDPSSEGFKEMAQDMAAILNVTNGDVRFTKNEYDKSIGRLMRRVMFAPRWLTSRIMADPIGRLVLSKGELGRKWLNANNIPTDRKINPYVLRANYRMVLKAQALWYALLAYFGLMRPFDQFKVQTSVSNMYTKIQVGNYVFKAPGGSMMFLEIADALTPDIKNLPPDEARKRFGERMETLVMGRFINSPGIGIMKEMFTGRDFMGKPVGYVDPDLEAYWQKVVKPTMAEVGVPAPDMRLSKLVTKNLQYLWIQSYLETFKAADDREEDDKMFEAAFVGGMSALGGRIRYNPPVGKGSYDYDTYGNPPGIQYYILGANREEWLMNPAAELSQEQIDAMEKEVVE